MSGRTLTVVTTPIETASTKVHTLTFDGATIRISGKRRGRTLGTIPLTDLAELQFKPARSIAGGWIVFVLRSRARPIRIPFTRTQQPWMQQFANTVLWHHRGAPPPTQPIQPAVAPDTARLVHRLLTFSMWTEGIYLAVLVVPMVVICGLCGWFMLAR